MNTVSSLKKLSESVFIGHHNDTLKVAEQMLGDFGKRINLTGGNTAYFIKGESDRTVLLEAHIDEIGFTVTEVCERGFLRVATAGGFDLRALPSHRVTVHGKEKIEGVFTSIPPHLTKDEAVFDDIDKLYIDTGLGERAKGLVSVGDFVTYKKEAVELLGGRVTGKSLDNRAGVLTLLLVAEKIKAASVPANVVLLFCNQEEIGTRGAVTSAFALNPNEAICVDVSFGDQPGVAPAECGKLGHGPMIGVSPILSKSMYDRLRAVASKKEIPYQCEVMGGRTATDADMVSISREGVPTALVSIPLRNMHTDAEVVDTADIESAAALVYEYILAGGNENA
ncbi:MAG: M20/M25/M40 family metallo-hydrolase [Clostridia bacterium]|nr:M20/M25/M40 family metallo-hydrolase [Clostridia bacterium]